MEEHDLLESTIIVITANHGEEFWKNSELQASNFYDPRGVFGVGHGHNVFNKVIDVPILMNGPGIPKIKSNSVSTIDIMPTILDKLKVNHSLKLDGLNIFRKIDHRFLLSEAMGFGYEKRAQIHGKFKLIYSKYDNITWLFDLEKDLEEKKPIKDKFY